MDWMLRIRIQHVILVHPHLQLLFGPTFPRLFQHTELEHTLCNLYQQAISRDSFHSWRTRDCPGCVPGACCNFLGTLAGFGGNNVRRLICDVWPRNLKQVCVCVGGLGGVDWEYVLFLGGQELKISGCWWSSLNRTLLIFCLEARNKLGTRDMLSCCSFFGCVKN